LVADTKGMSAAIQLDPVTDANWRVTRDGDHVTTIAVRQQQGETLVSATSDAPGPSRPYRFDSLQAADAFLSDLMTSFSYLGCDIAVEAGVTPSA
jgi:hypothetical protein